MEPGPNIHRKLKHYQQEGHALSTDSSIANITKMTCRLFPSLCAGIISLSIIVNLPLHADSPESATKKGEVSGSNQTKQKSQIPSLYRNTHILINRGQHTIIPKGSIIYLPSKDKAKVCETPSGKFTFWPDFIKKNQSWIWLYEITLKQARGLEPIPEHKLKELAKLNRVVVATYRKNPISISPPPAENSESKQKVK